MIMAAGIFGGVIVYGQAPAVKPLMAEDVFKNVQVLKGIPIDQFMGTMGIFGRSGHILRKLPFPERQVLGGLRA